MKNGVGARAGGNARRGRSVAADTGMLMARMVDVVDNGGSRRDKGLEAMPWKSTSGI